MKIYRALIICSAILFAALGSAGQTTWSEQDYTKVTDRLSADLLNSSKLSDYIQKLGRKPNVSVGLIRSEANNNVDLNELIRRFEYKIFNSNVVEIIESADFRDEVRKERATQSEFEKEQAFKKWGKEAGANLILFGDLTLKTETRGNKSYYYYTISLFMTDIETNTRIWFDQEQVRKQEKIELTEPSKFDSRTTQQQNYQPRTSQEKGIRERYFGIDFNRIHPITIDYVKPGSGFSIFTERSFGGKARFIFGGWSFDYYQFGANSVNLGSGNFYSSDSQSQFYGTNNYNGSFSIDDRIYSVRPYINFRVTGRAVSFYTIIESGLLLFNLKKNAQVNIQSQSNPSAKIVVTDSKKTNSVTLTYGIRMGVGYRIAPKLELSGNAGFMFAILPLQTFTPSVSVTSTSPEIYWNKDLNLLLSYSLNLQLSYRIK
jgi:hypothetical protein